MKRVALLVTPLPPLETGLATFAGRIVAHTRDRIDWIVAYASGGKPLCDCDCIPISELANNPLPERRIYQLGNSTHCSEVFDALERWGGAGLFHEVNFHHVLRERANSSGNWADYHRHIAFDFGKDAARITKIMNVKAASREEYDRRLRRYPLFRRVAGWCSSMACLNSAARSVLSSGAGGKHITVIGHPLDPLPVTMPEPSAGKPGVLVAGVAGGFGYGRGWGHVINAVRELRKKTDAVLVAVGAGWPDPNLDWVKVTGRLSEPEYQSTLRTLDLAFDLREYSCGETSGSLLELLRAGIPTITSDTGAFREIPSDAVMRVSTESLPDSAAAAASYLVAHPAAMKALSRGGAEYARIQGDPGVFRDRMLEIVEYSLPEGGRETGSP